MASNLHIQRFGILLQDRFEAAQARVADSCRHGKQLIGDVLAAFWAQRPRDRAHERRFPGRYFAEYKTVDGDVFRIEALERFSSEDVLGEFKKCYTVPTLERIEFLARLSELGFPLGYNYLCGTRDAQKGECRGCRLFKIGNVVNGPQSNE